MNVIETLKANCETCINDFTNILKGYYVGRPTPMLLDNIKVDYYDERVPIENCAVVSVQSSDVLLVRPWESSMLKKIEKAINAANINLTAQADSEVVKVYLPRRTKEEDMKTFKLMKKQAESAKVSIRQCRQEARDQIKNMEIVKDLITQQEKEIQKNNRHLCRKSR